MAVAQRRKKRSRRWIIIGAILIVLFAAVAGITAAKKKTPVTIDTCKPKIGTVEEKLTETGNIELLRTVEVKSKIAGTVSSILVREGETVSEGQVLAVIDPDPTQTLLLLQKRSAVTQGKINLEQAEKELTRKRELARSSLVSEKELEDSENQFLLRRNSYQLAMQELAIMEREIETAGSGDDERIVASKVRAPYDGYVTLRHIEEGAVVTSGISSVVAGTNLFQIGDPSTKVIKAQVSEVDIGRVDVGNTVRILLDAYPDTSFTGSIRHISPVGVIQQGRSVVTFKTEIDILDDDPRLRPGMSCDVDIIIASADSAVWLPIEAVYEKRPDDGEEEKTAAETIVFVKNDDFVPKKKVLGLFGHESNPAEGFEELVVETGIKSENRVQITANADTALLVASDSFKIADELKKLTSDDEKNSKQDGQE